MTCVRPNCDGVVSHGVCDRCELRQRGAVHAGQALGVVALARHVHHLRDGAPAELGAVDSRRWAPARAR